MQWIHSISLKQIKGPTLYTAIVSALVMVAVHGLGWHLNTTTIVSFFGIVGSFVWNNGRFGFGAVHKANFWITIIAAAALILNKGLGLNVPTPYIIGFATFVIAIIFHVSMATAAKMVKVVAPSLNTANPVAPVAPKQEG